MKTHLPLQMLGTVLRSDDPQHAWPWPDVRPARLAHALAAALRRILRACRAGGTSELRMSREWLEEHRRRGRRDDG